MVAAFPVTEEHSTDGRIGQDGVSVYLTPILDRTLAHNDSGCTRLIPVWSWRSTARVVKLPEQSLAARNVGRSELCGWK